MPEAERRLTTIVAADIAGFSRLIGTDEEGTLAAQRSHRSELIEPLLAEYHGRIANTAGDSFLFDFPSAVEAIRCAIAIQDGMAERNHDVPSENRIEYCIGINVGDVMAEGDDLLGDLRTEGSLTPGLRPESLFSPAGLDVGADEPEQIALAVVAEIQAVFSNRSGSWLRDRKSSIHDPTAT